MKLDEAKYIYFLGIGGIGMSALARYFHRLGKIVSGYDKTITPLTKSLQAEGISIHYDDAVKNIPNEVKEKNNSLIIYTPAIPSDNTEYTYFKKSGYKLFKRSEILGMISNEKVTIGVAGTHGKTTISTMISYLLANSDLNCSAFLGGISKNFNSNLVVSEDSSLLVVEADEFDRSFLQLHPKYAVISALDADHLDIYGSKNAIKESFTEYVNQIREEGVLLIKKGIDIEIKNTGIDIYTYDINAEADFYAENIRLEEGKYFFNLVTPAERINNLSLSHPGLINVENAVAALAISLLAGMKRDQRRYSLDGFSGILRRFEVQINSEKLVYIDDYAHHPEELRAIISSVKELFQGRKITGIFQPHLFSRTRDFYEEFAQSLNMLDELFLLDIYPARELPIEGVTSDLIFRNVNTNSKIQCTKEELVDRLKETDSEVVITMGAGDIDQLVGPIKEMLKSKYFIL